MIFYLNVDQWDGFQGFRDQILHRPWGYGNFVKRRIEYRR